MQILIFSYCPVVCLFKIGIRQVAVECVLVDCVVVNQRFVVLVAVLIGIEVTLLGEQSGAVVCIAICVVSCNLLRVNDGRLCGLLCCRCVVGGCNSDGNGQQYGYCGSDGCPSCEYTNPELLLGGVLAIEAAIFLFSSGK